MLDLHSGIFAIQETGANIGPTVSIPAQAHTAARTIQYTSAWCVLQYLPTIRAGFRRIIFSDQVSGYSQLPSLVADIFDKLTMRPLADFLIAFPPQIHAGLNILHIPNRNLSHPLILAKVNQLPAGFMQKIPLLALVLGRCFSFVFEQFPLTLRPVFTAVYPTLISCQSLVSQALDRAQISAADYDAFALFGDGSRDIDLAQIHPNRFAVFQQGRDRNPRVHAETQFIMVCPPCQFSPA